MPLSSYVSPLVESLSQIPILNTFPYSSLGGIPTFPFSGGLGPTYLEEKLLLQRRLEQHYGLMMNFIRTKASSYGAQKGKGKEG